MSEVSTPFVAGRLHYFVHEWQAVTSDPVILDMVQHCHLDINVDDVRHLFSRELTYKFRLEEQALVDEEIRKLLDLHVIVTTQRMAEQIISPIFLRPKKDGGYRMVLNLKELNKHIPYKHFKMDNFEQAIRLINAGDYLASVDLRHAYYTVKIAEEQQKFLCFQWRNNIYQFTCLPNGISEGPRIFTKLMKPVFAALRGMGYSITSFIDDTLICNKSKAGCIACVTDTIDLLHRLGFCINVPKSVLQPTQSIEYLGNIIDTNSMTVSLPERRILKLTQACQKLKNKSHDKIREVARVTGLLVAAFPAVELGKLHYRQLEAAKIAALQCAQGNFDSCMKITEGMRTDLQWWLENTSTQVRRIFRPGTDIDIYTDASNTGWGGHVNAQSISGTWSLAERLLHINVLELKAILLVLQGFTPLLSGKHIKVYCDNTTAMTYVNEMGGTKSLTCNDIAIQIWDWCLTSNAWITCSHIPGKENTLADMASRLVNDRHEWKLDPRIFQQLCKVFGTPTIDLFASRINNQVPSYCSWRPDPGAMHVDAFSLNWARFKLSYIFPPFSLIARCLQKLKAEGARVWMVVPLWQSQPWMGTLLGMLIDYPRLISQKTAVLVHPSSGEDHPIMRNTHLMACLLSGSTYEHEEFLRTVQTSSWLLGNQAPRNNTARTLSAGHNFVLEGTLVPVIPLSRTL